MNAEQIKIIIYCATTIGGFLLSAIPMIIALVNNRKKLKNAKSLAEIEAANNELTSIASQLIVEAENVYKSLDAAMKAEGESAGLIKKDSVLTKLQNYAAQHGFDFDIESWSQKIDDIVALTRTVNAK